MRKLLSAIINIEKDDLWDIIQKIDAGFIAPEIIEISFPAYAIGFAGEHLSVCEDLIDISYCVEALAAHSVDASLAWRRQPGPPDRTHLVLRLSSPCSGFLNELLRSCIHFGGGNSEIAKAFPEYFKKYPEQMEEYRNDIENREFRFPELIDDYFANLINGAYYTYEQANWVQEDLRRYPERRFGFHRSAFSSRIGSSSYASIEGWIVPTTVNLTTFFKVLNVNASEENFHDAQLSMVANFCFATSGEMHVHFPLESFLKARVCQSFISGEEQVSRLGGQRLLFSSAAPMFSFPDTVFIGSSTGGGAKYRCRIHETGEIAILTDDEEEWHHIFFETRPLHVDECKLIGIQSAELNSRIQRGIGLATNGKLDWSKIDDERFESLCYDIIYANPGFDRETIRKMGRSRSRDGGRDIVVWTKPAGFREAPRKYIFQCKLITSKKSLGKRDVRDIGDMLEQYEAQGFGLMTSAVIDTTLFDAVDTICARRQIAQKHFSGFEIERFLNQRPDLRETYFDLF
jgi:hypothetical protein